MDPSTSCLSPTLLQTQATMLCTQVNFYRNKLYQRSLPELKTLLSQLSPSVRDMNLGFNKFYKISPIELIEFISSLPLTLERLNLSGNVLNRFDSDFLAIMFGTMPRVKDLDLSWNDLGLIEAKALAPALFAIPDEVETLNLSHNLIGVLSLDESIIIFRAFRNTNLKLQLEAHALPLETHWGHLYEEACDVFMFSRMQFLPAVKREIFDVLIDTINPFVGTNVRGCTEFMYALGRFVKNKCSKQDVLKEIVEDKAMYEAAIGDLTVFFETVTAMLEKQGRTSTPPRHTFFSSSATSYLEPIPEEDGEYVMI
jgi:hypothetical protein